MVVKNLLEGALEVWGGEVRGFYGRKGKKGS